LIGTPAQAGVQTYDSAVVVPPLRTSNMRDALTKAGLKYLDEPPV
jgi:hypothetical protein